MSQKLPTRGFNRVDDVHTFTPTKLSSLAKNFNTKCYLLEVNIGYSKALHDLHNDLPFMCRKIVINKGEKLVPNLYDKKNSVIHIRVLNQSLKHGLIFEKFHLMAEFYNFNMKLRTEARTISKRNSSNVWIIQFLVKLWRTLKNIRTLNS